MRAAKIVLAIAFALALQTSLAGVMHRWGVVLDLVLVVVVFVGLTAGPAAGLLTGMVAGVAQDTLSGGIIGLGGLVKTLVGFAVGVIGSQFIVAWLVPRFLVFVAASAADAFGFLGLASLVGPREFPVPYAAVVRHAVGNGVVGVVVCQIADVLPGVSQKRQYQTLRRFD